MHLRIDAPALADGGRPPQEGVGKGRGDERLRRPINAYVSRNPPLSIKPDHGNPSSRILSLIHFQSKASGAQRRIPPSDSASSVVGPRRFPSIGVVLGELL